MPEEEDGDEEEAAEQSSSSSSPPLEERTACIVIDPFSHFLGKRLKRQAMAKGLACVDVLCPYTSASLGPGTRRWRPPTAGQEAAWAAQMPFRKIAFVLAESDVGTAVRVVLACLLACLPGGWGGGSCPTHHPRRRHRHPPTSLKYQTAERLQVALGVRGNGINPARRSKYLTNLALKARGAGESLH